MITPLLPVGELLSHSWREFTSRIGTFVKFGVCAFLSVALILLAIVLTVIPNEVVRFGISLTGTQQPSAFAIALADAARSSSVPVGLSLIAVLIILMLILNAAYLRVVLNPPGVSFGQLLREGAHRALPVLFAAILFEIIVSIGSLILVIPGIIANVFLQFALLAAAENSGPIEALKKSYALVHGHWWQTFGRLIVVMILFCVYGFVVALSVAIALKLLMTSVIAGVAVGFVALLCILLLFIGAGPWVLVFQRTLMADLERVHGSTAPAQ